ncbi:hypothetical protein HMPREF9440_00653 [Sutterella parvirubra YIT 11816]|uniref:Uncharacterized protein n=1 Tax=Sutterella parvirubra YIT 11816 TaxID=762967 RepID=H3KD47_9BURK|nr:hypothetical protein HMPREF9440_00653 [Sutterella parvirubra YIT 11816]
MRPFCLSPLGIKKSFPVAKGAGFVCRRTPKRSIPGTPFRVGSFRFF